MDFTALKTAIQNAIKLNGNEEITGDILQGVLLSMVSTLGDSAINDIVTAISNEATARQNGDSTLNGYIESLQGAINSINTAIGNGFVYAGIATPTTTPATGKVFYIALTAGTYTNFGNTEVSQGINILKYDGSDWSLDVVISFDNAPTPSSNNLVKSGGVFDKVMTDGSAFDISAYFASGGTLATYADLSAALTALNTLSASYKKGGMSIKFVQSSDNKYVQYRLRSNSFTTNVIEWINSEVYVSPDTNSTNVAESLIVDDEHYKVQDARINPITKNIFQDVNTLSIAIDEGKWYANTGYDCKIIKVYPNEIIDLKSQANRVARYAVLKSVGTPVVGNTPDFALGYSDYVQVPNNSVARIKIPADGQFLYLANNIGGNNYYPSIIEDANTSLDGRINTITELSDYVLGKNFIKGLIYNGYLNDYFHTYKYDSSYGFVIFRVYPKQKIRITAQQTKLARYTLLASFDEFYDGATPYLCDGVPYDNNVPANTSKDITIPSDGKYLLVYDTLIGSSYYPSDIMLLNGDLVDKIPNVGINNQNWMVEKTTNYINLYKNIGNNDFIKYPIQYYHSDYSEGAYPSFYDCWDMDIVKLCHYDGETMIENFALFREGLAECAISVPRGDGQEGNIFVGGGYNGHGFENIVVGGPEGRDCRILINKQKVLENSVIPLQELVSFSILQKTQMYQAYSNSNPFAEVIRKWWIDNGELRCKVSLTFLRVIFVVDAYIGMMCVLRHQDGDTTKPYITNKCITNDNPFYVYDFSSSPVFLPISLYREKIIEYGQLGLGFSESVEENNKLSTGGMLVSDNGSTYNKIYFSIGKNFESTVSQNLYATFKWDIE